MITRLLCRSFAPTALSVALIAGFALGRFSQPHLVITVHAQQRIDLKRIHDLLDQIDRILENASEQYQQGKLDKNELSKVLYSVSSRKFEIMHNLSVTSFPLLTFDILYVHFAALDRWIDRARDDAYALLPSKSDDVADDISKAIEWEERLQKLF